MTIPSIEPEVTGAAFAVEKNGFSLISDSKLLALYAMMLKCRMIGERAQLLRRRGMPGEEIAVGVGWEAAIAGVAVDLLPEDTLCLSSGSLVAGFVKGIKLERLFARPGATDDGRHSAAEQSGNGGGGGIAAARTMEKEVRAVCDAALANKVAGNGRVATAFCADWPEETKAWRKALHDAGEHELSILFVIYKDVEATGDTDDAQSEAPNFALEPFAYDIPAITVDGNDVVAVYRVAFEALARARRGRGATLIECVSTRIEGDEGMNGVESGLRKLHDPILMMQSYLKRKGLFNAEAAREMAAEFGRELDAATGCWMK